MKKNIYKVSLVLFTFMPMFAFAVGSTPSNIQEVMSLVKTMITDYVIPLIFGFAIVVFLWGVLNFIKSAGDPKARETGRGFMLWGIIGLAVMISVWALVKILTSTLGITDTVLPGIAPKN